MKSYFSTLKQQANSRAKESTLSVLGISDPALRNHLAQKMGDSEPFVHGPVFEQTFAWEHAAVDMSHLNDEGLLSEKLINALDSESNDRYALATI